jgi:acyl dehydratase
VDDDGPLYLEDLRPGQRFTSATYELGADEIVAFASDYDPQPFHTDPDAATDSFFGGLVASGWHTAGVAMRLLVRSMPIAGGIIGAGGELSWPAPTRPGSVLRVEAEIVEVRPSRSRPELGMVVVRIETRDQDDVLVQVFTPTIVVPRRPGAGED